MTPCWLIASDASEELTAPIFNLAFVGNVSWEKKYLQPFRPRSLLFLGIPWRWRQQTPPKRRQLIISQYFVVSHNILIFICNAVKTSYHERFELSVQNEEIVFVTTRKGLALNW